MPDFFVLNPNVDGDGPPLLLARDQDKPTPPADPTAGAVAVASAVADANSGDPTDGAPYDDGQRS